MSKNDKWECRLDAAGRRRYYLNDKVVAARNVPESILSTIQCPEGAKTISKKTPPKKAVPKKEVPKRFSGQIIFKSYLDLVPLELLKLLMLYFSGKDLNKICDVDALKSICGNDEFWHRLVVTQFVTNPRVKEEGKKWTGWRDYYIQLHKEVDRNISADKQVAKALLLGLDKLVMRYIDEVTDPELLYAVLVMMFRRGEPANFDFIKYLIENKKVDWPKMYQQGINSVWNKLNDTYHLYMSRRAIPIRGSYPVEVVKYLLDRMPEDYLYKQEILQRILDDAIYELDMPLVDYLLKTYHDVPFNFIKIRYALFRRKPEDALAMIKLLKKYGLDVTDEDLMYTAVRYNSLPVLKYLHEQGVNIRASNDAALILAAQGGHLDIVDYLVKHGADIHVDNDAPLRNALLPLTYKSTGTKGVVRYLLKHGADTSHLSEQEKEALKKVQ